MQPQQQPPQPQQDQMVSFQYGNVPAGVRGGPHQHATQGLFRGGSVNPRHRQMIFHQQSVVLPYGPYPPTRPSQTMYGPMHFPPQLAPGSYPFFNFPIASQRPGPNGPMGAGPAQQQMAALGPGQTSSAQMVAVQSASVATAGQSLQAVPQNANVVLPPQGGVSTAGNGGPVIGGVSTGGFAPNSGANVALMTGAINLGMPPGVLASAAGLGKSERKIRKHALDIVNPDTQEVVIKGYDGDSPPQLMMGAVVAVPPAHEVAVGSNIHLLQQQVTSHQQSIIQDQDNLRSKDNVANIGVCVEMLPQLRVNPPYQSISHVIDISSQPTPVVSAMSDGPSVDIHPKHTAKLKKTKSTEVTTIGMQSTTNVLGTSTTAGIAESFQQQQQVVAPPLFNQQQPISVASSAAPTKTDQQTSTYEAKIGNKAGTPSGNDLNLQHKKQPLQLTNSQHKRQQPQPFQPQLEASQPFQQPQNPLPPPQQQQQPQPQRQHPQQQQSQPNYLQRNPQQLHKQKHTAVTVTTKKISESAPAETTSAVAVPMPTPKLLIVTENVQENATRETSKQTTVSFNAQTKNQQQTIEIAPSALTTTDNDLKNQEPTQKQQYSAKHIPSGETSFADQTQFETSSNSKVQNKPILHQVKVLSPVINEEGTLTVTQQSQQHSECPILMSENKPVISAVVPARKIVPKVLPAVSFISPIEYDVGQWSPHTPDGRKIYNRRQLMALKDSPFAKDPPDVTSNAGAILLSHTQQAPQASLMPPFMRGNNRRGQSMGGLTNAVGNAGNINMSQSIAAGSSTSISGMTKSGSKSGNKSGMIHVSLSLREDVKLNESENAWRPASLVRNDDMPPEKQVIEELFRRVRGILNKLTPENFNDLVEQIMKLQIDTPEKVQGVMILVFEKAIDEPNFSELYAKLCETLATIKVESQDPSKDGDNANIFFKSALIDKMQHEFDDNVLKREAKEAKLRPIVEKIKQCDNDPDRKAELEATLDEEERKIRRRSGGTVRFIGELFKIGMLTQNIIYNCIQRLLDHTSEDKLECLCKLLTTVGKKFEQNRVASKSTCNLEGTIKQMQKIADRKTEPPPISSRIRFMLQDVIDMRKNNLGQKKHELTPKTMDQIQREVENEQLTNQYLNNNYQPNKKDNDGDRGGGNRGGGGNNRFAGKNGGSSSSGSGNMQGFRSNDDYYNKGGNRNQQQADDWTPVATSKSNRTVDASKLVLMSSNLNEDTGETVLGKRSQFQWDISNQSSCNSFAALSSLDANRGSIGSGGGGGGGSGNGPKNRGSYSKGSMERDRYDGPNSRSDSQHDSRENSSSRQTGQRAGGVGEKNSSTWMYGSGGAPQNKQKLTGSSSNLEHSTASSSFTRSGSGPRSLPDPSNAKESISPEGSVSALRQSSTSISSKSSTTLTVTSEKAVSTQRAIRLLKKSPAKPVEFEDPLDDDLQKIQKAVKRMFLPSEDSTLEDCVEIYMKIPRKYQWALVLQTLEDYLALSDVKSKNRRHAADVFVYLYKKELLSVEDIRYGYNRFTETAEDIAVDVPKLWPYVFEFIGIFLFNKILRTEDIWNDNLAKSSSAHKREFVKSMILYLIRDFGPNFTRNLWIESKFKWSQFIDTTSTDRIQEFIQKNKFEFIDDPQVNAPLLESQLDLNRMNSRIKELLSNGYAVDTIIDYIKGNINPSEHKFVRGLTTTILEHAIENDNKAYKLNTTKLGQAGVQLLQAFIDGQIELELDCLHAVQELINRLEHPPALISDIFIELYDQYVIPQDSFYKWRDSKEEQTGKGVAVKSLNSFFEHISADTSDENN